MADSFDPKAKEILVEIVTQLLIDKPKDPVPYIYSYLVDLSKNQTPEPLTENEVNELRNLKKKVEYLRDQVNEREDASQQSDDEEEDDVAEIDAAKKEKNAKKGQRGGVSAEVYGAWNKKEDFKPRVIEKTAEQIQKLNTRLMDSFLFRALDEEDLKVVVGAIEEKQYKAGEHVIKEGDQGDEMFVLESGSLDCTKVFKGNTEPTHLKTYEPGEGFGELALLYNAPRAATITAKTDSICWALDRPTFNNIVKDAAAKKREKYDDFLNEVQILKTLDPYERSRLGDAIVEEKFKKDDFVIREGDIGDKFFLIVEGTAIATKVLEEGKEATKVKDYQRGDYFGERALLMNEPRAANIVVTSDAITLISMERKTFIRMMGPLEDLLKRNIELYEKFTLKK